MESLTVITSPRFFWSGIFLGFIGCLFYANFREPAIIFDSIPVFALFSFVEQPILLPNSISEWIPSFLHIIGMSFFTAGILKVNQNNFWKIPVAWLIIDLVFEGLQAFQNSNMLTWGNFEWVDVIAMTVSTIVTLIIFKKAFQTNTTQNTASATVSSRTKSLASAAAFSVGAFMMLGSYELTECEFPDETTGNSITECEVEPIYLSWEKVRESGKLLSKEYGDDYQQPLKNANKIYTYKKLLLINEERTGVHLYDNSNPDEPKYLNFISLIGNQDMAINNQYLYLDSFTDLVIFDLTQLQQDPVRKNNLFTFPDAEDNLPSGITFKETPKATQGVVIGYINEAEDKFYFWSDFSGLEE